MLYACVQRLFNSPGAKICKDVQSVYLNVSPCLAMSRLDFLIERIWRRRCCAICTKNLAVLVIPGMVPKGQTNIETCENHSSTLSLVPRYQLWAFHIHDRTPIPPVRKRTVWPSLVAITGSDDSKSAVQSRPRPWQHGPYAIKMSRGMHSSLEN